MFSVINTENIKYKILKMKNFLLILLTVFFFIGCSNKNDNNPEEIDDTYFFGVISWITYDLKNGNMPNQKFIKTILEKPIYRFEFDYTAKLPPSEKPVMEQTILTVDIESLDNGKTYKISHGITEDDNFRSGITYRGYRQEAANSSIEEKVYTPVINKKPIVVTIDKIDMGKDNVTKTVEGRIKGYLFNKQNLTDSIKIDSYFRTRLYK